MRTEGNVEEGPKRWSSEAVAKPIAPVVLAVTTAPVPEAFGAPGTAAASPGSVFLIGQTFSGSKARVRAAVDFVAFMLDRSEGYPRLFYFVSYLFNNSVSISFQLG